MTWFYILKHLLQPSLDYPWYFAKTVISDPLSKTLIQAKGKNVSKKKHRAELVQDNRKLVEKEEKEKVWEFVLVCVVALFVTPVKYNWKSLY